MAVPWMDHRAQYHSLKNDIDAAIQRVIESGEYIVSEDVYAFEREFADYCGASHGISVRSGHDAILVALLALGIGSGDEVITPDNGCPSIPLAISHTGARPVYADIDEKTLNLDPTRAVEAITPRTKAILGIHSYGQPCAVKALKQLAEDHGLIMVEDCSLATGARVDDQRVGNLGHIGVFSLSKGKILNSYGNGAGMIVTDDASVAERATMYARYGFRRLEESDGLKYEYKRGGWVCAVEGYNSHMDSIQAAVLRIKLAKMDQWIEQRNQRARQYDRLLAGLDVTLPYIADNVVSAYRGYTIRVKDRYEVWDGLRARGIDAKVMFLPPTHMQPVWRRLGYKEGDFPVTEMVAKEMLSLPIYPELSNEQVREVVAAVEECVPPTGPNPFAHLAEAAPRWGQGAASAIAGRVLDRSREDMGMPVPWLGHKVEYETHKGAIDGAIQRVLQSGQFQRGPEVDDFELEFARFCEAEQAIGTGSCYSAMFVALLACGVGHGDEVITVANTDIATTAAISHTGAQFVWVDIDELTYNIDPAAIEAQITPRTKAILPVHMYGLPADMDPIMEIARRHGLWVIDDAALAVGARYKGRRMGTLGHVCCFSFVYGKGLGALGDAGMAVTNDAVLTKKMRELHLYSEDTSTYVQQDGITLMTGFRYTLEGHASRLMPLYAAVLREKLPVLDTWIARRREIAQLYGEQLSGLEIVLPYEPDDVMHVYRNYAVRVNERDRVRHVLAKRGIPTGMHYVPPLHRQPVYDHLGYKASDLPNTESAGEKIFTLPMYPELTDGQVQEIAEALTSCVPPK